jgi:hypothetical protein
MAVPHRKYQQLDRRRYCKALKPHASTLFLHRKNNRTRNPRTNARLKELRQDPKFQVTWNEAEVPVQFKDGAQRDDMYLRFDHKNTIKKLRSAETAS